MFDRLAPLAELGAEPLNVPEQVADLREFLAGVPDPRDPRDRRDRRDRRGVRHSAGSLLALAAAAVLAGAWSFAAIGETCTTTDVEHGRTERRTVQLAPLGDYLGYPAIDFPHATQAFLIERYITHHTSKHSAHTAPTPRSA